MGNAIKLFHTVSETAGKDWLTGAAFGNHNDMFVGSKSILNQTFFAC